MDSCKARDFGEEDVEFLRTYATILGPVIDRLHKVHSLEQALRINKRLLQELQHHMKNQISIFASSNQLQASQVQSKEVHQS